VRRRRTWAARAAAATAGWSAAGAARLGWGAAGADLDDLAAAAAAAAAARTPAAPAMARRYWGQTRFS
jgi:hypothetical protein